MRCRQCNSCRQGTRHPWGCCTGLDSMTPMQRCSSAVRLDYRCSTTRRGTRFQPQKGFPTDNKTQPCSCKDWAGTCRPRKKIPVCTECRSKTQWTMDKSFRHWQHMTLAQTCHHCKTMMPDTARIVNQLQDNKRPDRTCTQPLPPLHQRTHYPPGRAHRLLHCSQEGSSTQDSRCTVGSLTSHPHRSCLSSTASRLLSCFQRRIGNPGSTCTGPEVLSHYSMFLRRTGSHVH